MYALMMRVTVFLMPPSAAGSLAAGALVVSDNNKSQSAGYSLGVSGASGGLHKGEEAAQVENQREPATHSGRVDVTMQKRTVGEISPGDLNMASWPLATWLAGLGLPVRRPPKGISEGGPVVAPHGQRQPAVGWAPRVAIVAVSPSLPVYDPSTTGRNQIRQLASRDSLLLCLSFLSLF